MQPSIHRTLAKSYLAYFIVSILALLVDTLIGFEVSLRYADTGMIICFAIGTILIAWAQTTSKLPAGEGSAYFFKGPYRFMRNPTHLGIVFLVVGYTLISGSIVFSIVTIVGYLISNVFFGKYEALLDRTYGDAYKQYQSNVPKIF